MTTEELKEYYANLLILQYVGNSNNFDMVKFLASMAIMDQLPVDVQNAYDIDTAVGVQLDVLGKYAGVTRTGPGFYQTITLDDDQFRILIQIAILQNSNGSSLADIQSLLHTYFNGVIYVFDYGNMRISYMIDSDLGDQDLIQVVVNEGLLSRPMGVQMATVIYAPVINKFFGMRTYNYATTLNSPFNTYGVYHTDWPWLSYLDGVYAITPAIVALTTEAGGFLLTEDGGEILT